MRLHHLCGQSVARKVFLLEGVQVQQWVAESLRAKFRDFEGGKLLRKRELLDESEPRVGRLGKGGFSVSFRQAAATDQCSRETGHFAAGIDCYHCAFQSEPQSAKSCTFLFDL